MCPVFPANGRTLYQGHLFVGDRLLNEFGMEKHPLTPMTDPDIRRWLSRQTRLSVGHLPLQALRAGTAEAALHLSERNGDRLIVADAITDADLLALGTLARSHRLVTGGSGIAMGLPGNFGIRPGEDGDKSFATVSGPAIVLSGSCSSATRRQIDAYRNGHPSLRLDAADVLETDGATKRGLDFITANREAAPLIYSTAESAEVAAAQDKYGRERLATLFESIFAELALKAVGAGFRRLVVAGGETSGAVASAFGPHALKVGPEIDTGVPVLVRDGEPRLAFALKSGNFGGDDFFARAVEMLTGGAT